jgi:hypothetical protein
VRKDEDDGGFYHGSIDATTNQALLYFANYLLTRIGELTPKKCGAVGPGGEHVTIQASQTYLVNGMSGKFSLSANQELVEPLFETRDKRMNDGFIIRWEHLPANQNAVRDLASQALEKCVPTSLDVPQAIKVGGPWDGK